MATFQFFTDPALSVPLSSVTTRHAVDGSSPPVTIVLYYGSTATGKRVVNAASPGVGFVTITPIAAPDALHTTSEIKLALTLGGLSTATPGGPLSLGTEVLSGAANAIPIYLQVSNTVLVDSTRSDLALQLDVAEEVVP